MASQVVLNNKESTYGGPYGYYTVTLTPSNRTANSVTVKCDVSAHLKYSDSYTQYGVTCGLYIGGEWHDFTLVSYGTYWRGTSPISKSTTITVSGLTASQASITGIKFRAIDGGGVYEGPSLSATACSNLTIDSFNAHSTWSIVSTTANVGSTLKVSISSASKSNYHAVSIKNGTSYNYNATTNLTGSLNYTYSITLSPGTFGPWFGAAKTSLSVTVTVATYDADDNLLGSDSKSITLNLPSSVGAPTGMKLAITSVTDTELKATITPPTTKYGATISSYSISTNNGTVTRSGTAVTVKNASGFGNSRIKISGYATDSRGFKSNTAVVEKINTLPKIFLNNASYEKVISHKKNVIAIYRGSTRIM